MKDACLNWKEVEYFPRYSISEEGIVINQDTGKALKQSKTQSGQIKVGLVDEDGKQRTMLVKTLVARAFVPGQSEIYDTVISLDGDQENVHHANLLWRPRWFALQWARQQTRLEHGMKKHYLKREIMDLDTRVVYPDVPSAATDTGSAHAEIFSSCNMIQSTWPDLKQYRYVRDIRLGKIGTEDEYTQVNWNYTLDYDDYIEHYDHYVAEYAD